MEEIRVLLADDHEVVLDSLAMMLSSLDGIRVSALAKNGHEVLEKLSLTTVDLVVSDMHMPGLNGVELALRVRESHPDVKVVLLTMDDEPETIRLALRAGAAGYVLKKASRKELQDAILAVARGEKYVMPDAERQLGQLPNHAAPDGREASELVRSLSKREIEIIRLIVNETSGQDIAEQLFISPNTVETHRRNIFKKLGIHSVVALTRFALENKVV